MSIDTSVDTSIGAVVVAPTARPAVLPPGTLRGFLHQLRYDLLLQARNPVAVFFTVLLPLAFLLMFTGMAGGDPAENALQYVPATMVIGLLSGTMTNLSITLAYLREYGMLRHVLVTPLPRVSYLSSRVVSAGVLSLASTVVLGIAGAVLFGATPAQPAWLILALLIGTTVGSALGVALAAVVRSEIAATPLANAITLPLLVVSGAFFPLDAAPDWVQRMAQWLPGEPVVTVATAAYRGEVAGGDVARLALVAVGWTAIGALVARRWFSWTPRSRR
jgi:ABC-2 type transport system permease protein